MDTHHISHVESSSPREQVSPSGIVVKYVAEGQYDVIYHTTAHAIRDARVWQSGQGVIIPAILHPREDGHLLLDVTVRSAELRLMFLCWPNGHVGQKTAVEWVGRRRTDAELLELWIDMLAESSALSQEPSANNISGVTQIFNICRRALASDPFMALGVPQDATRAEIEAQYSRIIDTINRLQHFPQVGSRVIVRISQARVALKQVYQLLQSEEGRAWARTRFP